MKEVSNKNASISISGVLPYLGVSKAGYYKWLKREPSNQEKQKKEIKKKIRIIFDKSYELYGSPKITYILNQHGITIAQKTVLKYMHELGITPKYIKHWTQTTRNSDYSVELKNILDREFNPEKPNAVWCTDITYIWTWEGFVYLSSVMDLYSRKIIAWVLNDTLEADKTVECIKRAKLENQTTNALIIHSDRGSQYVSDVYHKVCGNVKLSYSRKGTPYDNACIESFHSLIKREWLNDKVLVNFNQAYIAIFEYIETFYNTVRIHSHCSYISPEEYITNYYMRKN